MDDIEDKFLQRLQDEAAQWVEKELFLRMRHAKEAIEEQVNTAQIEIGPKRAADHLKKALSFAQENIRMDLEMQAQVWMDEEIRKRKTSLKRT